MLLIKLGQKNKHRMKIIRYLLEYPSISRVLLLIILACYLQVGALFPAPNVLSGRLVFCRKTN